MSRYGIQQADPDCYGLLVDQSEEFMKSLVAELVKACRIRLQDGQPDMRPAKPGDTYKVDTVSYVNEEEENTDARSIAYPNQMMFQPKAATPLKLMCTKNPYKEMNYIVKQEYTQMKEK